MIVIIHSKKRYGRQKVMNISALKPYISRSSNRSHLAIIEEKIQTISGETITRRYSRGRMLGKGGFAKCYEVTNMDNKKVLAAKIIQKSSLKRKRAK